jgi:hypothetical protein
MQRLTSIQQNGKLRPQFRTPSGSIKTAGEHGFDSWAFLTTKSGGYRVLDSRAPSTMQSSGAVGSGLAWGVNAGPVGDSTAAITYNFGATVGPLQVGQYLEWDFALPWLESNMQAGIQLLNASNTVRLQIFYWSGQSGDAWRLSGDAGGLRAITGPDTTYGSSNWPSNTNFKRLRFTQQASNAYDLSFWGTAITNSGRTLTATDITQIRFYTSTINVWGLTGNHTALANNLVIGTA